METTTKFKPNSAINSSLMELPILKHFNQDELKSSLNSFKGKNLYWFLKFAVIGGTIFSVCKWVLPEVFKALGKFLAVGTTIALCILAVMLAPAIFKFLRWAARNIHKAVIRKDPFLELENQRGKMIQNQQTFRMAKGKIQALKNDMEVEASKSENEATVLQTRILSLQTKVNNLKRDLDDMVAKGGAEARNSDEYVNGNAELVKMLSESTRVVNKLTQCKDFVQKYGSRAAIMKKFAQKMVMVEASIEIKIADFDATVEMLKKDFEFGQKSKAATTAAKDAMLFTKTWELEYALDVVTSTIATDIAITAGNLRDIDSLTSQYALDSDELYANLNTLADNIKVGKDEIPTAKKYTNPDYVLTESDKVKSGGFQDLM